MRRLAEKVPSRCKDLKGGPTNQKKQKKLTNKDDPWRSKCLLRSSKKVGTGVFVGG